MKDKFKFVVSGRKEGDKIILEGIKIYHEKFRIL
jgi:hypothetical protein